MGRSDVDVTGWAESDRGVSFVFGYQVIKEFNKQFDLSLIVRGHQVVEGGYDLQIEIFTVFSAPNYCGEFDNAGGVMTIDEEMVCSKIIKPAWIGDLVIITSNEITGSFSSEICGSSKH